MTHQIRGRHILGGIGLAALFSLPFDVVIVSATITGDRLERAMIASQNRAAKRAADRAIADTVSAAPQPDQSALISRAQAEETTEESSPAVGGDVVSRDGGTTEAGAAAESGVGAISHPAPRTRSSWSARSSSSSTLQGRAESASVASAQSVRSERSPLETHRRTVFSGSEQKASGGRSLHSMADAAATLCGVPSQLYRDLIARDVSPTLDVRDPWQNLVAGACLLRQYRDRFGSWRVALHAYHGGPTRVDQRRTTKQSRDYARDVIEGSAN